MIILGLDASTKAVGWCLFDTHEDAIEDSGTFIPTESALFERLEQIEAWLTAFLTERKCDEVAIEQPFSRGNAADTVLAYVGWRSRILADERRIVNLFVPAATAKKHVSGSGRATKREVRAALERQFGGFVTDDEADAAAVAITAATRLEEKEVA